MNFLNGFIWAIGMVALLALGAVIMIGLITIGLARIEKWLGRKK